MVPIRRNSEDKDIRNKTRNQLSARTLSQRDDRRVLPNFSEASVLFQTSSRKDVPEIFLRRIALHTTI